MITSKDARKVEYERIRKVENERANFRKIIATNANYFGNLLESKYKVVKKIVNNTSYEELTCVGYNLNFSTLEATIEVKQEYGYKGNLCSAGSKEYVRFFIDYGSGWEDAGVASLNVHDIPDALDCAKQKDKPLTYVVSLKIEPKTDYCKKPVIANVRAILSWEIPPPAGPANVYWSPVWGNSMECHIQIRPRKTHWFDIIDELTNIVPPEVKIPSEYKLIDVGPIPDPPQPSLAELSESYQKSMPHRFGLAEIHAILNTDELDQTMMANKFEEWSSLGLDLAKAIEILENTNANVDYEEIECLGLDYHDEKLVATLRIKKKTGYSGELCKPGSFEYVSFWADWDNECKWTLLGIKKVNVHDLYDVFPKVGICYSVIMPVDLSHHRQGCNTPKIGRIRAVLSWNIPPSTTDPDKLEYWGNRIDTHVQIKPGDPINPETSPRLVIGGIHVSDIHNVTGMTLPDAKFPLWDVYADQKSAPRRPCPFGGQVIIQALDYGINYVGRWYKVEVRNITAGSPWTPLNNPFQVQDWDANWNYVPQSGDFFQIQAYSYNPSHIIQRWGSSGDDLWEIRITVTEADLSTVVLLTTHRIQLDNTVPDVDIQITTPATSGGCKYTVGTTLEGWFVARDANIGSFDLYVTPSGNAVVPSSITPPYPSIGTPPYPPGQGWTLPTSGMDPCGYNIWVHAIDRSILNSTPQKHHSYKPVGFCLDALAT